MARAIGHGCNTATSVIARMPGTGSQSVVITRSRWVPSFTRATPNRARNPAGISADAGTCHQMRSTATAATATATAAAHAVALRNRIRPGSARCASTVRRSRTVTGDIARD